MSEQESRQEPRARIVPVLVGQQDQELWQRLVQGAELRELADLPEIAPTAQTSLSIEQLKASRESYGPRSLLLLLADLDALHSSPGPLLSQLPWIVKGDSPFGKAVIVVLSRAGQVSTFRNQFPSEGIVVTSVDDPKEVRRGLVSLLPATEGSNDPASNIANAPGAPPRGARKATAKSSPSTSSPTQGADDPEAPEAVDAEPAPFENLRPDDFTGLAWNMIEVARRLGQDRPRPEAASVRRLLTSILLSGLARHEYAHTGSWLIERIGREGPAIRKRLAEHYPVLRRREASFDSLVERVPDAAARMTGKLREILDLARRLARQSQGHDDRALIGARHLLGAALRRAEADTNVGRFLRDFGLDVNQVRGAMIASLRSWEVPDDPNVWLRLLDPVVPDAVDRRLPTYAADSAAGPDWIGITREVEAMASLVSAWAVEPPLSIGLFGEWGSGKSFFMQKMKERVRQISSEARKSGGGQKEFGYYKNIVQVEFNAWHYVEGNLWASLVEHIFTNLKLDGTAGENVDSEEHIEKRLQRLLGEVREKTADARKLDLEAETLTQAARKKKDDAEKRAKDLEGEAEAARKQAVLADEERADAQGRAEEAQRTAEAKGEERRKIELKDLLEEVAGSQELRDQVRQGLAQLGITKERLQTVEDLRGALREAADAGTLISQGIGILRTEKRPWRLIAWVLIVPALVAGATWALGWLGNQQDSAWLQSVIGVISAVSAVPALLIGAWKKYGPKLKPVLKTIEDLKLKRTELEARVEEARQRRSEKAAELDQEAERQRTQADAHRQRASEKLLEAETERRSAAAKQAEAAAMGQKADQARREVEKLAHEAELLRPERRIAAFIQDRAAAKDYRRHLGVPAIIRRDFEKLAAMFRTQRKGEEEGQDGANQENRNDLSVVNRIILYIDDLDRCPPKKVVEVLQAIHLLLAFPLFVVIVAVDARWMKRSLKNQFTLMLAGPDETSRGSPDAPNGKEEPVDGRATPDDYLEKIFQVPFWIRPLGKTASRNLVLELTKNDLAPPPVVKSGSEKDPGREPDRPRKPVEREPAPVQDSQEGEPAANAPAQTANASTPSTPREPAQVPATFSWSPVEPKPRTLQLSQEEREYMVSLATVIGRSPRSVKRFVNCYRLLKSTIDPAELARSSRDGTFRTTMLLLGIVSGLPEIAPELLTDLRAAKAETSPAAWAREATQRLGLDERGKWGDLLPVLRSLHGSGIGSIAPLAAAADHVDRFSFNPVRAASAG